MDLQTWGDRPMTSGDTLVQSVRYEETRWASCLGISSGTEQIGTVQSQKKYPG